jgi:hypothetical protein
MLGSGVGELQEVSGGLEAIIKTPGENDLVAIAKHYGRDPKVFAACLTR